MVNKSSINLEFGETKNICGIYCIFCHEEKKYYIGQSRNIMHRWRQHIRLLDDNKHHSAKLQQAWNTYGISSFCFNVIKLCDISDLNQSESEYIQQFNCVRNGYNVSGHSFPEASDVRTYKQLESVQYNFLNKLENLVNKRTNTDSFILINTLDILEYTDIKSVDELEKVLKMSKQKHFKKHNIQLRYRNIHKGVIITSYRNNIYGEKTKGKIYWLKLLNVDNELHKETISTYPNKIKNISGHQWVLIDYYLKILTKHNIIWIPQLQNLQSI